MGAFNALGDEAADGGLSLGQSLDRDNSKGGGLGWSPHLNIIHLFFFFETKSVVGLYSHG